VYDETRSDPRPGILVVHGGAGLDAHAEGRAHRLAELGYVAFACDMYGDGVAGDRQRIMARIAELRADRAVLSFRARAGIDSSRQPHVDGRIAAVGYCFGGIASELARSKPNPDGVVSVMAVSRPPLPQNPVGSARSSSATAR
jgi:dienelactone hydrolase